MYVETVMILVTGNHCGGCCGDEVLAEAML